MAGEAVVIAVLLALLIAAPACEVAVTPDGFVTWKMPTTAGVEIGGKRLRLRPISCCDQHLDQHLDHGGYGFTVGTGEPAYHTVIACSEVDGFWSQCGESDDP